MVSRNWSFSGSGPHPSPLPKGEGTDWGILKRYTDLKVIWRIHNRHRRCRSADRERHLDRPPLPPGEGWGEGLLIENQ
ncbi:hypothetical protein DCO47_00195 [Pseudomonas sp. NDM]|nr:hypothetical protein DCO47_00195 [Pseudomonas sp. NDM]